MKNIIIDGVEYTPVIGLNTDDYVIIRTYSAGVHFGKLERKKGQEVELSNARRVYYWKGAASLSQMATEGVKSPDECKISVSVPTITLTEAIEIIPMTDTAHDNLYSVKDWRND